VSDVTPIAALRTIDLPLGEKHQGKVRDWWIAGDRRVIVTTDRLSAFDRVVAAVPYKGQVLNRLSAWWFERTADIVPNAMLSAPDANTMICRNASPWPVEMVIRGYITGVTSTSLWHSYAQGERVIYGLTFPDGLEKNQKLPEPVITPTTKADSGGHDERLTREEILARGLVPEAVYLQMEEATRRVFQRGTEIAAERGLILVDTKYEFGEIDGRLALIDEVHTPDSSRYWMAASYPARLAAGEEPETYDKEVIRRWLASKGYTGDGDPPFVPPDMIAELTRVYVDAYERLTGEEFVPASGDPSDRICDALRAAGLVP
jgi:phosphoribosylaminoimidazole-succinocarboxamide synthase